MKKVTLVLLTVCLCFGLCFSAYADDMYYQGDAKYPIAFVQWGKGYVLDLFSVQELEYPARGCAYCEYGNKANES